MAAQAVANARGNFQVTVSIGMAPATLGMSGIHALMQAADRALYRAKELGRNRVAQLGPATGPGPKVAAQ